jgi:hypothetical protein
MRNSTLLLLPHFLIESTPECPGIIGINFIFINEIKPNFKILGNLKAVFDTQPDQEKIFVFSSSTPGPV